MACITKKFAVEYGHTDGNSETYCRYFDTEAEAREYINSIELATDWEREYTTSHYTNRREVGWSLFEVEYDSDLDDAEFGEIIDSDSYGMFEHKQRQARNDAERAWEGSGWYTIEWSDGGSFGDAVWFDSERDLLDNYESAWMHMTDSHIPYIEYCGDGKEAM